MATLYVTIWPKAFEMIYIKRTSMKKINLKNVQKLLRTFMPKTTASHKGVINIPLCLNQICII